MAERTETRLAELARQILKGEEDALFSYGATKPDAEGMAALDEKTRAEVAAGIDVLLGDTRGHVRLMEEIIAALAERGER